MTSRFWYLLSKKISGEASHDNLQELDELFRDNPDWAYSAGQLQKIWKTRLSERDDYGSQIAFDEHLTRLKQKGIDLPGLQPASKNSYGNQDYSSSKTAWLQAVGLVVVFTAIALLWQLPPRQAPSSELNEQYNEVLAAPRSKIRVLLPDSSVVWLNAGSKLTYSPDFGVKNRNATLIGEAYFNVRKRSIPFVIHTNGVRIKVLGTVFNVRSYPDEKTETSLLHGSVEITLDKRPGEKYLLKPNEKLVVANSQNSISTNKEKTEPIVALENLRPTEDNTFSETSWVDDRLVFQDEPFSELAMKMERWYGVKINIQDERIATQRVSGILTTETIQEAMDALQLSTSFHYDLKSNLITITR
jgi:transmembrane sensor